MGKVAVYYLAWHYTQGIRDFLRIWGNFIWFIWNFFSVGLLARTFFMPFRRIRDERKKGVFDPGALAEAVVVDILMRVVGMVVRSLLIVSGIIALLVVVSFGALLFLSWIFMPLCYAALLLGGLLFLL